MFMAEQSTVVSMYYLMIQSTAKASMVRDERTCMDDWLNVNDREKPVYLRVKPIPVHLVYHKSHMDLPGIKHVPLRKEAGD